MDLHVSLPTMISHQHRLPSDYEGAVVTTLLEAKNNTSDASQTILYVHGFSDYFFQEHLMDFYTERGINFFAIDLRKYGRSLLPHQRPNYCRSMTEYFTDLEYAISFILKQNERTKIFLLGHSTGGLLVTYYAQIGKMRSHISGLILNSPFFRFNVSNWLKPSIPYLARLGLKLNPFIAFNGGVSPIYGQSLHRKYYGEWEFDLNLKPVDAFPAYLAWILAVYETQEDILNQPFLAMPILLMYASKSSKPRRYKTIAHESDIVLNVDDIKEVGEQLGSNVTSCSIQNGIHDLFLASKKVRDEAMELTITFLANQK